MPIKETSAVDSSPLLRKFLRTGILALTDASAMIASLAVVSSVIAVVSDTAAAWEQVSSLLAVVVVVPVVGAILGLHADRGIADADVMRRRLIGLLVAYMAVSLTVIYETGRWDLLALLTLAFLIDVPIALSMEAVVRRHLAKHGIIGASLVLLGATPENIELARRLRSSPHSGFRPVAFIDDVETPDIDGLPAIRPDRAKYLLRKVEAAATTSLNDVAVHDLPVEKIMVVPLLESRQSLMTSTLDVGGGLGVVFHRPIHQSHQRVLKRLMDYIVAIPAAILSLPIIALLSVAIFIASPGSPFYRQKRAGYRDKDIYVIKMRSMYPNADERLNSYLEDNPDARAEWNRHFKLKSDPRILPGIGNIIRKGSLDELPQLWNVLRGDMSVVGPRPFPDYHMEEFPATFRKERLSVPQGLTGLWQVSSRSDGDIGVQMKQDGFYIRNWSIWLDVYILLLTLPAVLLARGAR